MRYKFQVTIRFRGGQEMRFEVITEAGNTKAARDQVEMLVDPCRDDPDHICLVADNREITISKADGPFWE